MPEAWAFHQTNFSERQVARRCPLLGEAIFAAVSFRWRPKWPPYKSCSERNTEDALRGEIKRALVESGITRFLPPHSCPEKLLEHFLLESANNGIFVEHVLERRVAFQNLRAAIVRHELRHVTFRIANFGQRFSSLRHRRAFDLLFQARAFPFKQI